MTVLLRASRSLLLQQVLLRRPCVRVVTASNALAATSQVRGVHTSKDNEQLEGKVHDVSVQHFRRSNNPHPLFSKVDDHGNPVWVNPVDNKVWSEEEVKDVKVTHIDPKDRHDRVAYYLIRMIRRGFDIFSGYAFGPINEHKFLRRVIFLETVAGIPGMVAGSLRHLKSLRLMKRDHGWIHTLLEEAENERMHLLTFMQLREPGLLFRGMVLAAQGVFWNLYFLGYLASPRTCHRFVGYLEEEAVKTYTDAIKALDDGLMPTWTNKPAPDIAKTYWGLADDALMRDVLLAVRADEANHRDVNHTLSTLKTTDVNPYVSGK
ncbi:alternative oxidase [Salpingoeca rosetta]|uniref:Alternative oxidase n=1 Tax=Salpingoeca rosetta (strain ATCC 50818 / BSB-021) TaxID=946362 RepID=F2U7V2_SALR5|nr:alternative oxidase [Salpingoeca rosetta]EGD72857.1 alternative oxidase [Salpingoeca rosetta]|eukprot:XP_004994680.1 alternative oxidase [Salpingoeca rosetta]